MFAVLQIDKNVQVSVMGMDIEVPLIFAEGMIGAIPVFKDREAAEEFAGDKFKIAELTVGEIV